MSLVFRAGLRHHLASPGLLALSVIGVAAGVALVVGVDAANSSARRAFTRAADALSGRATHVVEGASGSVPDSLVARLATGAVGGRVAPVVEGTGRMGDVRIRLVGVDPLVDAAVRDLGSQPGFPGPARLLVEPGAAVLSTGTASRLGIAEGDTLGLQVNGIERSLHVAGIVDPGDPVAREAWEALAVVDISTGQEVLGIPGLVHRVDLVVDDADDLAAVRELLGPGFTVEPASARGEALIRMTEAFDVNLRALSHLSLLVGLFLAYNVISFSVSRRRAVLGRLRAIGVDARTLRRQVFLEAGVVGSAGTLVGLALGAALGSGLVTLVTRAINDLYFVLEVRRFELGLATWLKAGVLGIGSTLLAAWGPAWRAAAVPPSIEMRRSQDTAALRARMRGLVLAATGAGIVSVLLLRFDTGLIGAYAGLLALVVAFALVAPAVTDGLAAAAGRIARRPGVFRLAVGALRAHLGRASVAVAALALAVAASIGVSVMVTSFRGAVEAWLGHALPADVYVRPPSAVARFGGGTLHPDALERVRSHPAVSASYGVRSTSVSTDAGPVQLVAIEHAPATHDTYRFLREDGWDPWVSADSGERILVSEPFAFRTGLDVGDTLRVDTRAGPRPLRIAAVFADYGSDLGALLMGRPAYDVLFDDPAFSGLALTLVPGADRETVMDELRESTKSVQALEITSSAGLRAASMEVFDRTFAVTTVLRLLALVVAFVGIVTTLASQQIDRAWEFGVLRALGLGPRAVRRVVATEATLMGAIAGLAAVPLGLALAAGLVFVVNRRSFGWTLPFDPDPWLLVQAIGVATAAGAAAGWLPALRLGRTPARQLLAGTLGVGLIAATAGCGANAPSGTTSVAEALAVDTTGYERVLGPEPFEFPRDHGAHDGYLLEWWYFTGNLDGPGGRRFGYQFTVFRNALAAPAETPSRVSAWGTTQLYSAHLALTDGAGGPFLHEERFARGAAGMAGAEGDPLRVWVGPWQASGRPDSIRVEAEGSRFGLSLLLRPEKPIVLQGDAGFSRKGDGPGQASRYYAVTRLTTEGTVRSGEETVPVTGTSWFDREWSTSLLGEDQVGWDWFSLHLDTGDDLMLFRLRRADGSTSFADASLVGPTGERRAIDVAGLAFVPGREWVSPATGARYPVQWTVTSKSPPFTIGTNAVLDGQELATRVRYWEGAVDASGTWEGRPVGGRGYVEMTGYDGGPGS